MMKSKMEMYWLAEYDTCSVSQFDSLGENPFSVVDKAHVKKIWWLPVTREIAARFAYTKVNPLLKPVGIDTNGRPFFIFRHTEFSFSEGSRIVSYKMKVNGRTIEIFPDGRITEWQ